jgi:transposase
MKQKPDPNEQAQLNQLSKEELVSLVMEARQKLKELEERITQLSISLNLDSKNSSKPPSTDLLKKSEKPKPTSQEEESKPKRKPGGQPGHQGSTRKGFNRIDRVSILSPVQCEHCGSSLAEAAVVKTQKQQVAQLVARPIEIVEYQRQHCQCVHCGQVSAPAWDAQMLPGQDLGIKLQSLLGWLGNYAHLPYEKQQELLWELGEIEVGVGTLVTTNQRVQEGIVPSVTQLETWIQETQPDIHVDETPWIVKGVKEWMWVFGHQEFCLFRAADTRSRAELEAQLGQSYGGTLCSDDFSVYNGYDVTAQQKCLAHLRRHFQKLELQPGLYNQDIAQVFIKLIDEAFHHHRIWRLTPEPDQYRAWATEFKTRIDQQITNWKVKAGSRARQLLCSLEDKRQQWWYFLEHPHVPPDNNLAERYLRLAVTKRKISGGSRSMERFEQTAKLLSVVQTCRRQGRSVIAFFGQALKATLGLGVVPSLIPSFST